MAWGPPGEIKHERIDFKTKDDLLDHINQNPLAGGSGTKDFVECYKEGDEIYYERESNRNRGSARYVGRRPSGMTYCDVIYVRMS